MQEGDIGANLGEIGEDRLENHPGALKLVERHVEEPEVVPDVRLHVVDLRRLIGPCVTSAPQTQT